MNNIINETSHIVGQVKRHLQQKIVELVCSGDQLDEKAVSNVFKTCEDPFEHISTTYLQSTYIKKNMNYVEPIQYVLATNVGFKNQGAKRQMCEVSDTMVYVPILKSIEQLLSNSRIFNLVTSAPKQCKEGVLYDVSDGSCYRNNPFFQAHPNALQLILYHDEVEVCNPLGSHIGKHKIDLFYYTLANINPKYRSKLCCIRLFAIAKAHDATLYGHNKVLTPLINDLDKLAAGHTFYIGGSPIKLYGVVVSCLGDTEGQHLWGGFKVGVGWSHQKCRQCLCIYEDMQNKFMETDLTPRTFVQYNQQCTDIETVPTQGSKADLQTTYGIKGRSILSELSYFDITKQLPKDIMHLFLEGSVQYEVRFMLQSLFETGATTLRQVNNDFLQLILGYHDEKNRPPALREPVFNGHDNYKLKQNSGTSPDISKVLAFYFASICSSR